VVSKRHAQAGEKLSPDSPVMAIVDLKHLTLDAQVPASDIPRVQGRPGRAVQGRRLRQPQLHRQGGAHQPGHRSRLARDAGVYRRGQPGRPAARRHVRQGHGHDREIAAHPLLPLGAVRKDNGRDVVYRVDGGKVVAQPVKLGLRNEDEGMVEALGGVDAGARVLAVPLDGVKPGVKQGEAACRPRRKAEPCGSPVSIATRSSPPW
jgi:membrane fusion protein (multidrug efflux system)